MFSQTKKAIAWKPKNYVFSIINFLIQSIIMVALAVGVIFINVLREGDASGFVDYFSVAGNVQNFVYLSVFTLVLNTGVYLYLYSDLRDFMIKAKNIILVFLVVFISFILEVILGNYVNIYARPIALFSLLLLLLINRRTAIVLNFIFALFVFVVDVFTNQPFDAPTATVSLVMTSAFGIVAVYLVDGIGSRIKTFAMGLVISVPIALVTVLMQIIGGADTYNIIIIAAFSVTGGMLSVVVMMILLPIFEWMFNVLTNFRLEEITDHKSKLIKVLINEAWGTFNHSLVVASLAETCAAAIEENPLLARAAAYYHDIGKLKQPSYFTENQHGYNPHDDLTPELSTEIIRSHTKDGYELIMKHRLPQILADVAREHHGTLPIQYFYAKAKKYTEGGELDIANFCYPGPKPRSKIAAIIMLADGCEASVRSLKDRSRDKVEAMVDKIFSDRMEYNQFSDCDITMREIELIKQAIINGLTGVYHDRIKYPDYVKNATNASEQGSNNNNKG